jgi:tRNA 2-selenouridine synthase
MISCSIEEFLTKKTGPIFDVRSPCEFAHGHIPGSISFPLFADEERARVGTVYKQNGHDAAVLVGLSIVGPKLAQMASNFQKYMKEAASSECRLLCYRGGMRSASVQWLSEFLKIPCVRLASGYKGYRAHVLGLFEKKYNFICIGGSTGSGKTDLLNKLKVLRRQVVDFESLANHRGSAFGLLPNMVQPTNEQFENCIAQVLDTLDPLQPIFIEDESRSIGSCVIPKGLYDQISASPLIWLNVDKEARLSRILEQYGKMPLPWLIECTQKLARRLGGERVAAICRHLEGGSLHEAAKELMHYYDAAYEHSLHSKARIVHTASEENFFPIAQEVAKSL